MRITEYQNPFDLTEGKNIHDLSEETAFNDWMASRYQGIEQYIALVSLNGKEFNKEDWGQPLSEDDDVRILLKPLGDVAVILALTILSVAATAIIPKPYIPELPEQSPTYELNPQRNQVRLGSGIPIHYGRVRVWPDLIAQPYAVYKNNEQYVYQLFCIGLGEFDLEDIHIGDTNVQAYPEITTEVISDGSDVTLFPTNVVIGVGPSGQQLDHESYVGPFTCSDVGTEANKLEVDLVFPRGLYTAQASGIGQNAVYLFVEYREVGGSTWQDMVSEEINDATQTPIRISRSVEVPPGRYEIRAKRLNAAGTGRSVDTVIWEGMRAYLEDGAKSYPGMTVLAVEAKATNHLNSSNQQRFNVVATRKLPYFDGNNWSDESSPPVLQATTSVAWALADIVRNGELAAQKDLLDSNKLLELHQFWDESLPLRGDEFNFRFDKKTSIWEALKLTARAGRAYPIVNGSSLSFVRTQAQSAPVTLFNRNNIIKDSFKLEYKFRSDDDHDSIMAEYIDPDIGWQKNVVLCQPPSSPGNNPKKVHYHGVTNRLQAFREGMYDAEVMLKQRKTAKFKTELEGYIPNRGDLVKIVNENFDMDQGGEIVAVNGTTLTVSEPLTWVANENYRIFLRKDNGELDGPHDVTEGASPYECVLNQALSWTPYTGGSQERTKFQFGIENSTIGDWIVAEIKPQGDNIVELTCVHEVPSVHADYDSEDLPASNVPGPILVNPEPIINFLWVENENPPELNLMWSPAPGAEQYEIERSYDGGTTWVPEGKTNETSFSFTVPQVTVHVRVAGISVEDGVRGPWKTSGPVGSAYVLNSPTNLTLTPELALTSSGDYQSNIVVSFDEPADDVHIEKYEVEYKLARHADWQLRYVGNDTTHTLENVELGTIEVRVRSVYVHNEVYSDWAVAQIDSIGTNTAISAIGLAPPENPLLSFSLDRVNSKANVRIEVGYEHAGGALPENFLLFYSVDDIPNALELGADLDDKLIIEDVNLEGETRLDVVPGSTDQSVAYVDPDDRVDIDLSGMWWMRIERPPSTTTRFHKIVGADTSNLRISPMETLDFVPSDQSGDQVHIIEISYHDSRLSEFKLAWVGDEAIRHDGIKHDGANYYLDVVERGAEGTTQSDQSGQTLHYFPAPGAGSYVVEIDVAEFTQEDTSGSQVYTGEIDLNLPAEFSWAAVSCCFVRKSTTEEDVAYVRSNILPLTVSNAA